MTVEFNGDDLENSRFDLGGGGHEFMGNKILRGVGKGTLEILRV